MAGADSMRNVSAMAAFLRMGMDELREERSQLCTLATLIERELSPKDDGDTAEPVALDLARVVRRMTESTQSIATLERCIGDLAEWGEPSPRAVN